MLAVTLLVKHTSWSHRQAGEQVSSGSRELRQYKGILEREQPWKKRQDRVKRGKASKLVENKAREGSASTYVS